MNVLFAGTPDFAATILEALLDSPHRIIAVYTQPDRPAGRGRGMRVSPVKDLATQHGIRVEQPGTLRDPVVRTRLEAANADAMVVAAYGLLLPRPVLEIPRLGCINVHASLLPRWRGAAPVQHAIMAGDEETGVSIMQMDEGLDTGPILLRARCAIADDDDSATLHARLAALGARALLEALAGLTSGALAAEAQDESRATYAPRLAKSDGLLDWHLSAQALERRVRAFNPWPVAYTYGPPARPRRGTEPGRGERIRIWRAAVAPDAPEARPGTVLSSSKSGIDVAAGEGALRILELQVPGARPMSAAEYLNAHALPAGTRLGDDAGGGNGTGRDDGHGADPAR